MEIKNGYMRLRQLFRFVHVEAVLWRSQLSGPTSVQQSEKRWERERERENEIDAAPASRGKKQQYTSTFTSSRIRKYRRGFSLHQNFLLATFSTLSRGAFRIFSIRLRRCAQEHLWVDFALLCSRMTAIHERHQLMTSAASTWKFNWKRWWKYHGEEAKKKKTIQPIKTMGSEAGKKEHTHSSN